MKHFLLLSTSVDSFSQVDLKTLPGKASTTLLQLPTPDTLRAIILVTTSPNGIAHARMGYVVIDQGKRPIYLDCRKRALKMPRVGWGWMEVEPNKLK